jgi:DNA-binding HxlR family transcriptional regulator
MVDKVKRYGQTCPLARALDVVGERWTFLILRELSLGPRRYHDLQDGLPGIPTNLLATRLKDLQVAGVVAKRTMKPPTAVTVYELTEAGRALRPVLGQLTAWGRRYGPPPAETDAVRPSWALLSASARPTALPAGRVCELRVDGESFQLGTGEPGLSITGGPAHEPDAVVTLGAEILYGLMSGQITLAAAVSAATVTGDPQIARAALETLDAAHSTTPQGS